MGKKWLFIYDCPRFLGDPENHRAHVRWVIINDEKEAECLARSNGLPWPVASAIRGTIRCIQIDQDVQDEDSFVERYLQESVENYQWFKEHYGPIV